MKMTTAIEQAAIDTGFHQYGYADMAKLRFYQEIRAICEDNQCRNYGTTWACPPAVGTVEECSTRVSKYSRMMIFSQVYHLEDSFDFEGMSAGLNDFKKLVDRFQQKLNSITSDYLLLSNEGCGRCAQCTYPDAPCRFPHLLHHSFEGYGLIVSDIAKDAGVKYNNGPDTVTFFGALFFQVC